MKISTTLTTVIMGTGLLFLFAGTSQGMQDQSPINPCLDCHTKETPDVVKQWEAGKHSKTGVKCYVCHHAGDGNEGGMEHNGFSVVTVVDQKICESCHPENAPELLAKFTNGEGKHP